MAQEIRSLASETERNVSWWLQKAWETARTQLLRGDQHKQTQKALKRLSSLRGSLKRDYPHLDSVSLSHQAFLKKK